MNIWSFLISNYTNELDLFFYYRIRILIFTGVESRDLYRKGIEILQRRISSLPTSDESLPELRRQLSNAMVSISEIYMTDLCDEPEAEDESK